MSHMSTRASRRKAGNPYNRRPHHHHRQPPSDSEEITFRGRRGKGVALPSPQPQPLQSTSSSSRPMRRYDSRPPLPPPPPPPPLSLLPGRSENARYGSDRRDRRDLDDAWTARDHQQRQSHDSLGGYGSTYRGSNNGDYDRNRASPARYNTRQSSSSAYVPSSSRAHHTTTTSFNSAGTPAYDRGRGRSSPEYGRRRRSASRNGSGSYTYPSTPVPSDGSGGGVALPSKYDGGGQDYRGRDQWRGANLPPPPPPLLPIPGYARDDSYGRFAHPPPPPPPPIPSSSYRGGKPVYPPNSMASYPESAPYAPSPRDFGSSSSREPSRGRVSSREYHTAIPRQDVTRRSENRYPPPSQPSQPPHAPTTYSSTPIPPRGPLSSARFRQGIDKRSRYSAASALPPHTQKSFPPFSSSKAARGKKALHHERPGRPDRESKIHAGRGRMNPPPPPPPPPFSPPPPPRSDYNKPPPHHQSPPIIPQQLGGTTVPTPTASYLSLSLQPTLLPSPVEDRAQLLVLDLNGTLLARKCGRAKSGSINPTPRPGLHAFLRYIFARFSVMVWSSARPDNVGLMLAALFTREQRRGLVAEWARDTLGLTKSEYNQKVQVYKRLDRVWEGVDRVAFPQQSGGRGGWDQTNTMLIDDSPLKALGQPYNHVEVSEFLGTRREMMEDRVLLSLTGYLEEIRCQGNVSAYIRTTRFCVSGEREQVGREVLAQFGYEELSAEKTEKAEKELEERDEKYIHARQQAMDKKKRGDIEEELLKKKEKKAKKKERKRERERLEALKAQRKDVMEVTEIKADAVMESLAVADVEGVEMERRRGVGVESEDVYDDELSSDGGGWI